MYLSFHRAPGAPRFTHPCLAEEEPAPPRFRKPNVRGEALRRRVLNYLRHRGASGAGLTELSNRFGGYSVVVPALLSLAQLGHVDVQDHDRFRARAR